MAARAPIALSDALFAQKKYQAAVYYDFDRADSFPGLAGHQADLRPNTGPDIYESIMEDVKAQRSGPQRCRATISLG